MAQAKQARQVHTEDEAQQEEGEQYLASDIFQSSDESPDLSHLALRLIAALSACVQRVSSDLAQARDAGDLEEARQQWAQQLRALADLAAGAPTGQQTALLPSETPLHELPPYPRRAGTTQPITATTRVPVASTDDPADQAPETMPINPPLAPSYRWVPLPAREREVLKLTQKGYPPRRIAPRLVIEVETVYTHLRNSRRKQRAWEQAHLAQQARQPQQEGHHEEKERLNPAEQREPTPPTPQRRRNRMRIAPTQW